MKSMLRAPENFSVNSSDDHYSNLDFLILCCLLGIPCCLQEMGKIVLWINLVFLSLFYLIYILGFERMRTRVGALKRKVNTTWYSWRFSDPAFQLLLAWPFPCVQQSQPPPWRNDQVGEVFAHFHCLQGLLPFFTLLWPPAFSHRLPAAFLKGAPPLPISWKAQ